MTVAEIDYWRDWVFSRWNCAKLGRYDFLNVGSVAMTMGSEIRKRGGDVAPKVRPPSPPPALKLGWLQGVSFALGNEDCMQKMVFPPKKTIKALKRWEMPSWAYSGTWHLCHRASPCHQAQRRLAPPARAMLASMSLPPPPLTVPVLASRLIGSLIQQWVQQSGTPLVVIFLIFVLQWHHGADRNGFEAQLCLFLPEHAV